MQVRINDPYFSINYLCIRKVTVNIFILHTDNENITIPILFALFGLASTLPTLMEKVPDLARRYSK